MPLYNAQHNPLQLPTGAQLLGILQIISYSIVSPPSQQVLTLFSTSQMEYMLALFLVESDCLVLLALLSINKILMLCIIRTLSL